MKTPIVRSSKSPSSEKFIDFTAALDAVFHHKRIAAADWPPQSYGYLTWDGRLWIRNEDGSEGPWTLTKADYQTDEWRIWRPN